MRSFTNYQKISELPTTTENDMSANVFEGDGVPYKGKLIGMEDLATDRDEKLCLDALFKLKGIAHARGEHKQKIQLNLTLNGINVYDESTKVQLAFHEVQRISFVIIDPRDPRAFGYIYNTTDDRHQFWAIKTDRLAHSPVFALKDLFEEAFRRMSKSDKALLQVNQTALTPVSLDEVTVSEQQSPSELTPVFTPQTPKSAPLITQAPTTALFDDTWGMNPSATIPQPLQTSQQQPTFNTDAWGFSEPAVPVKQPAPHVDSPINITNLPPPPLSRRATVTHQPASRVDSPANIYSLLPPPSSRRATVTQQPNSTAGTGDLFSLLPAVSPTSPMNNNGSIQQPAPTAGTGDLFSLFPTASPISSINNPGFTQQSTSTVGTGDLFSLFPTAPPISSINNPGFTQQPTSTVGTGDLFSLFPTAPAISSINNPWFTQQPTSATSTGDLFSLFPTASPTSPINNTGFTQQSTSTAGAGDLFSLFPAASSASFMNNNGFTHQPVATADAGDLFSLFPTTSSTTSINNNRFTQPTQQTPSVSEPQQLDFLGLTPVTSMTSPTVKSSLSEFDLLGDFS